MHPKLATWLKSHRPALNARFANARRRFAALDSDAFLAYLRTDVDALASALDGVPEGVFAELFESLYELGLKLIGQAVIGAGARYPMIVPLWHELALRAPRLMAQSPQRILSALANACIHVADQGCYPEFHRRLLTLTSVSDVDSFLRAGQVAAWRSGLAHYRASALAVARHLDGIALGLALEVSPERAQAELSAQVADRWYGVPGRGPRVVARIGQFRGLGGPFIAPPRVAAAGGEWLARSGDQVFVLHADAFGSSFHAVASELWPGDSLASTNGIRMVGDDLQIGAHKVPMAGQGDITSVAENGKVLAVTRSGTHQIAIVVT